MQEWLSRYSRGRSGSWSRRRPLRRGGSATVRSDGVRPLPASLQSCSGCPTAGCAEPWVVGVDLGKTGDPTAIVAMRRTRVDLPPREDPAAVTAMTKRKSVAASLRCSAATVQPARKSRSAREQRRCRDINNLRDVCRSFGRKKPL